MRSCRCHTTALHLDNIATNVQVLRSIHSTSQEKDKCNRKTHPFVSLSTVVLFFSPHFYLKCFIYLCIYFYNLFPSEASVYNLILGFESSLFPLLFAMISCSLITTATIDIKEKKCQIHYNVPFSF